MIDWLRDRSVWELVWLTLLVLVVLTVLSAFATRALVRRGMRAPFVIRFFNRIQERVVEVVKRPITIAVLDEVADVIQTGHYTRNISAALVENHDALIDLVSEKVRNDPSSRVVSRIPGYDAIVGQVSETTLRVLIEMLGDPRMDELVSDLLRNNLQQIKLAVRERQNEAVPAHTPPDPVPPHLRHISPMTGPVSGGGPGSTYDATGR
ncbi:hypothetical protein ASG49_01215 [Marmoricola sp. Leaf446]|uniref:hypothetical protein n=1 Tax=Marmoricola sp. Leaf446 TaxID=1736379 RepID=UPI0006F1D2D6|nr:hypothetical protein [Marmoricola sp. Leaf446]KQT93648.1 hypothetical protein ASG49_01215 [Marmoricola sp. Leaf446]